VETLTYIETRCGNLDSYRNKVWEPWQGVGTLCHIETRCGNLDSHRNKVWKPWQGVETLTHKKQGVETLASCQNLDSHRNKVWEPWQGVETLTDTKEPWWLKLCILLFFFIFFWKRKIRQPLIWMKMVSIRKSDKNFSSHKKEIWCMYMMHDD